MAERPFEKVDTSQWHDQFNSGDRLGEAPLADLIGTIEGEIVPRLLMSVTAPMLQDRVSHQRAARAAPIPEDVAELSRLLLAHDATLSAAFVQIFVQRGIAREHICRELLAPAARHLGQRWSQSECDFGELTVGLSRLRALLRELIRGRT